MHSDKTLAFITKSRIKHGDTYDYSKSVFVLSKLKLIIKCDTHGDFLQTPDSHLQGRGCEKCGKLSARKKKTKTLDTFLLESRAKHGLRYGYSKVVYLNRYSKVVINCENHGDFLQAPEKHLAGQNCPLCVGNVQKTTLEYIQDAVAVYGTKFDYSKVDYVNALTNITIICKLPNHGEFSQLPNNHLAGHCGCSSCYSTNIQKTTEQFICDARNVHGTKYNYSKVDYITARLPVIIICEAHGEFLQTPGGHLAGHDCSHCSASKGYSKAQIDWLEYVDMNEDITIQHALSPDGEYKIKTIGKVDGYCEETNTVYEYHGSYWHGDPAVFHPEDMNKTVKKTFGELYQKTLLRDEAIRKLGYNLVVKWESDEMEWVKQK